MPRRLRAVLVWCLSRACAGANMSAGGRKSVPGSMSRPRTGRASPARPTLCAATPFVTRTAEVLDEPPPIALRRPAQPTPHRRRRHSDRSADPAMPQCARVRRQRSLNPFRRRRSAQQHGHRQQHVRHCVRPASRPARPHQTLHASNLTRPCFPQPPSTPSPHAGHLIPTARQPGLDADRIDFYRHHRCLLALRRGTP